MNTAYKVGERVFEVFTGNDGTVTSVKLIAGMPTYYVLLDGKKEPDAFYCDELGLISKESGVK